MLKVGTLLVVFTAALQLSLSATDKKEYKDDYKGIYLTSVSAVDTSCCKNTISCIIQC